MYNTIPDLGKDVMNMGSRTKLLLAIADSDCMKCLNVSGCDSSKKIGVMDAIKESLSICDALKAGKFNVNQAQTEASLALGRLVNVLDMSCGVNYEYTTYNSSASQGLCVPTEEEYYDKLVMFLGKISK